MNSQPYEQRHTAINEFLRSLEQLEATLSHLPGEVLPQEIEPQKPRSPRKPASRAFSLQELEEAAADIEQFMRSQNEADPPQ